MDQPPDRNTDPRLSARAAGHPKRTWSLYLMTVSGIPIYLHATFLLVLAILPMGIIPGLEGVEGMIFFILIFVSVALHELGHAMMARRFGIQTKDIVLYPIGGVASLKSMGEGLQEFWIAVAGPAVNVVIAVALGAVLAATGQFPTPSAIRAGHVSLLTGLLTINVILFVFNLIPAFPMDGGRVLRSLLTVVASKERATSIASHVGQAIAVVFVVGGLMGGGIILSIIGIFVFFAAGQEYAVTRSQETMTGHHVHEAMITHFDTLQHGDTLGRAADLLLATNQQDFPVMHGEMVVGVLSRKKLLEGLAAHGRDEFLAPFVEREFPRLTPWDDLRLAFDQIMPQPGMPVLVFDRDHLVGYITHENLMEFVMVEGVGNQKG